MTTIGIIGAGEVGSHLARKAIQHGFHVPRFGTKPVDRMPRSALLHPQGSLPVFGPAGDEVVSHQTHEGNREAQNQALADIGR
jgi:phosphoglycerate dehydrogenase-like enzyme